MDDSEEGWKSHVGKAPGRSTGASNVIKTGDGGERFRFEFPEVDAENWKWMRERRVNLKTGIALSPDGTKNMSTNTRGSSTIHHLPVQQQQDDGNVRRRHALAGPTASAAAGTAGAVVKEGESWLRRHKFLCAVVLLCGYVLLARLYE